MATGKGDYAQQKWRKYTTNDKEIKIPNSKTKESIEAFVPKVIGFAEKYKAKKEVLDKAKEAEQKRLEKEAEDQRKADELKRIDSITQKMREFTDDNSPFLTSDSPAVEDFKREFRNFSRQKTSELGKSYLESRAGPALYEYALTRHEQEQQEQSNQAYAEREEHLDEAASRVMKDPYLLKDEDERFAIHLSVAPHLDEQEKEGFSVESKRRMGVAYTEGMVKHPDEGVRKSYNYIYLKGMQNQLGVAEKYTPSIISPAEREQLDFVRSTVTTEQNRLIQEAAGGDEQRGQLLQQLLVASNLDEEGGINPYAVVGRGRAVGAFKVSSSNFAAYGYSPEQMLDYETNLNAANRVLTDMINAFGDDNLAVYMGYHFGFTAGERIQAGEIPTDPAENRVFRYALAQGVGGGLEDSWNLPPHFDLLDEQEQIALYQQTANVFRADLAYDKQKVKQAYKDLDANLISGQAIDSEQWALFNQEEFINAYGKQGRQEFLRFKGKLAAEPTLSKLPLMNSKQINALSEQAQKALNSKRLNPAEEAKHKLIAKATQKYAEWGEQDPVALLHTTQNPKFNGGAIDTARVRIGEAESIEESAMAVQAYNELLLEGQRAFKDEERLSLKEAYFLTQADAEQVIDGFYRSNALQGEQVSLEVTGFGEENAAHTSSREKMLPAHEVVKNLKDLKNIQGEYFPAVLKQLVGSSPRRLQDLLRAISKTDESQWATVTKAMSRGIELEKKVGIGALRRSFKESTKLIPEEGAALQRQIDHSMAQFKERLNPRHPSYEVELMSYKKALTALTLYHLDEGEEPLRAGRLAHHTLWGGQIGKSGMRS